jgi:hypothetical protein
MSTPFLIALIVSIALVASLSGIFLAQLFIHRHPVTRPAEHNGHTQRLAEEVARDSRDQRNTIFAQMEALRTGRRD